MSLNGNSEKFEIIIHEPGGGKTVVQFSEVYQGINKYSEEFYKAPDGDGRARSGKLLRKFKWVINYYEIDWEAYIEDADAKKVAQVLNAEIQGKPIEIKYATDIPSETEFIKQSLNGGSAGKKMITAWLRKQGETGNKGLKLIYESEYARPDISWPDPADVVGYLVPGGEEYFI